MVFFSNYQYAYLVGNILLFLIWFVIFYFRKDLRKEQIIVGLIVALFAPITDYLFFFSDYWRPEYSMSLNLKSVVVGIESPLFGFLIGGISTAIYEFFMKRKALFSKPRNFLTILVIISNISGVFLLILIGLNSIWASVIMLILCSLYMVYKDKDLKGDMFWSSITLTFIIIVLYSIWFWIYPDAYQKFWIVNNLSGLKIGRIPIEEVVWFFSAGLFIGILYEFWKNVRTYRKLA